MARLNREVGAQMWGETLGVKTWDEKIAFLAAIEAQLDKAADLRSALAQLEQEMRNFRNYGDAACEALMFRKLRWADTLRDLQARLSETG